MRCFRPSRRARPARCAGHLCVPLPERPLGRGRRARPRGDRGAMGAAEGLFRYLVQDQGGRVHRGLPELCVDRRFRAEARGLPAPMAGAARFRGASPVWDGAAGSPFPGLSAFGADRGSVFFGRDLAIGAGDGAAARGAACLSSSSSARAARANPRCCAPASCRASPCPARSPRSICGGARSSRRGPNHSCRSPKLVRRRGARRELRRGPFRTRRCSQGSSPAISIWPSRRCATRSEAADKRKTQAHFESRVRLAWRSRSIRRSASSSRPRGRGVRRTAGGAGAPEPRLCGPGAAQRRLCALPGQ